MSVILTHDLGMFDYGSSFVWINPTNIMIQTEPIKLILFFFPVWVQSKLNQLKSQVDLFKYQVYTFQI